MKIAFKNKINEGYWINSIIKINFNLRNENIYKTFLTQEMLKEKILSSNLILSPLPYGIRKLKYLKSLIKFLKNKLFKNKIKIEEN